MNPFGPRRPAVVVGAARGIGAAVAEQLCALDMIDEAALVDRDSDALTDTVSQLGRGFPDVKLHPVVASMPDRLDIACRVLTRPGYGVVAAGIFEGGPSLSVDRESIERVVSTDLVAACLAARTICSRLAQVEGGSFIAISSIAARVPRPEQLAYAAAKAGLSHAMRVLGLEVAPLGVRINIIAPGITDTQFVPAQIDRSQITAGNSATYRARIPRGTIATPTDIARTVAVLLSPMMSHVYLHELMVDGGESLGI